jgi:hypothetical protein
MAKPSGDLGSMAISKAQAADSRPFTTPPPAAATGAGSSLTIKLDAVTYAALREFCYARERATGKRATHQQVVVEMIKAGLAVGG